MPRNVLVVGLGDRCVNVVAEGDLPVREAKRRLCLLEGVQANSFYLSHNGIPLDDGGLIGGGEDYSTVVITAHPILRGGKGGFGSLIRAMGMQINKSNKKEACRDLSGRRVRDVNAEKRVAKWLKEEPERRKKLATEKKKRLEDRRREPRHYFDDPSYMEQIKSTEESMDDALKQGLEAGATVSRKRKHKAPVDEKGMSSKKPKLWLGLDDDDLDSDSDGEGNNGSASVESAESLSSDEGQNSREGLDGEPGPSGIHHESSSTSSRLQSSAGGEGSGCELLASVTSGENGQSEVETTPQETGSDRHSDREVAASLEAAASISPAQQLEVSTKEKPSELQPVDPAEYASAEELESVRPERIKASLQALGLKCGGTLQERAQRLFSIRGKKPEEIDPSLFAKSTRQRKKTKK